MLDRSCGACRSEVEDLLWGSQGVPRGDGGMYYYQENDADDVAIGVGPIFWCVKNVSRSHGTIGRMNR